MRNAIFLRTSNFIMCLQNANDFSTLLYIHFHLDNVMQSVISVILIYN